MTAWEEVAAGVFRRRYQPLDVSVCVVRGAGGLLVCDTRSSHRQADEIRADLAELGTLPVRWVVNTHAHFDHCFGNARFGPDSDLGAPIYAHERVPAHLDTYERPILADTVDRQPRHRASREVARDHVTQISRRHRGRTDSRRGQPAGDPFDERPPVDQCHRLRQVWQHRTKAGPQTARQDHRVDILHLHRARFASSGTAHTLE